MRYYVLACDYDGTLAHNGRVNKETIAALERLRNSGRKLILVTGRELDSLQSVFTHLDLFDYVVAENGALLYQPATREERLLGEGPNAELVALLRQRGVTTLSVGRVIIATWEPNEKIALEAIRDLGLEMQVIFNKGAVMILPTGINKATGLAAALSDLKLSPHNVVGIGDAENDHAFLSICECGIAVANALPMVKERADFVTEGDHSAGVIELVDMLVATDLAELEPRLGRHEILLGTSKDGQELLLKPYGINMLLTGTSGSGKSTFALGFLERLREHGYQFCIIDPEGDYQNFEDAVMLGDAKRAPIIDEVYDLLQKSEQNVSVNFLGVSLDHRPAYFEELLPVLLKLRLETGRPHWIAIDETHHLMPPKWAPASATLPQELQGLILITVHPDQVAPSILASANMVIAIGESPDRAIRTFCEAIDQEPPKVPAVQLKPGEAIAWCREPETEPVWIRSQPPQTEHQRHKRKYVEGEISEDRTFFFRGPQGKLNLRANNLKIFIQLAEGIDDETWRYHLRQGDYSAWFREAIHDDKMADAAEEIEKKKNITPKKSREAIISLIEERYMSPED